MSPQQSKNHLKGIANKGILWCIQGRKYVVDNVKKYHRFMDVCL